MLLDLSILPRGEIQLSSGCGYQTLLPIFQDINIHMANPIYDKTDKGREELATRKYHLVPRLRTLLLLVDGSSSVEKILQKITGLGLDSKSFNTLYDDGFIQLISGTPDVEPEPQAEEPAAGVSAQTIDVQGSAVNSSVAADILPPGQTQFEAIYHFFNETIKSTIGLRGYLLQLKVERAGTVDDFRTLRQPYLNAVIKAKGAEVADTLQKRLDRLLYLDQPPPPLE
jgi:hypothetical protein